MSHPFERTWWIEQGRVLAGPYPGTPDPAESARRIRALVDAGVRVFVNLQEEDEHGRGGHRFPDYRPLVEAAACEIGVEATCHRFAVRDNTAASPELMGRILATIDDAVTSDRMVYVHCWGGHGRTGTVAGCWMVQRGMSADQALAAITEARRHDDYLAWQPSPQVAAQRDLIRQWATGPSR